VLTLAEEYALLAAIHDEALHGTTKLDPWQDSPDDPDGWPYRYLRSSARKLPARDKPHVRAILGEVRHDLEGSRTTPEAPALRKWQPKAGYIGVKTICTDARFRKNGKNPPRSTIEVWMKRAQRIRKPVKVVKAPDSGEVHLPEVWVLKQVKRWNPRP
jgi:hypothetical protein